MTPWARAAPGARTVEVSTIAILKRARITSLLQHVDERQLLLRRRAECCRVDRDIRLDFCYRRATLNLYSNGNFTPCKREGMRTSVANRETSLMFPIVSPCVMQVVLVGAVLPPWLNTGGVRATAIASARNAVLRMSALLVDKRPADYSAIRLSVRSKVAAELHS